MMMFLMLLIQELLLIIIWSYKVKVTSVDLVNIRYFYVQHQQDSMLTHLDFDHVAWIYMETSVCQWLCLNNFSLLFLNSLFLVVSCVTQNVQCVVEFLFSRSKV